MLQGRARLVAAALAGVALVAAGTWWSARQAPAPAPLAVLAPANYVDNTRCLGCHADQAAAWQQSHHAMAMATPDTASVRGNFDNATFTHGGITTRFFRRDGRYFVRTAGADGNPADFEVAYTFGVEPLQQYLLTLPGGRLQALQVAWDTRAGRWFALSPGQIHPPGSALHWTGRYQTANTMCLACHTTGYAKRYDAPTDTFASTWAEPNVSCQACHGPGETHVRWAEARQTQQDAPDITGTHYGLRVSPAMLAGKAQVDVCAACHSRRSPLNDNPHPGDSLLDSYLPALLTTGLYHADGQQLDEVFVYGSFRQSRMYAMGVTCTDCHDPHGGKPRAAGNALCTQCHSVPGDERFPTAAREFDTPAHHFHPAGSPGAQCNACHMPSKTYMEVQPRPDHAIRVPRPDLTVSIGTPNACTQCHTDRTAQWAADQVAAWYGPQRRRESHYGEVLAAARRGDSGAASALAELAADPKQPAIVRATALDALRRDPETRPDIRVAATHDPDPVVRAAAADSLERMPASQRLYALAPLLQDPVRAVRTSAARALSSVPPSLMGMQVRPAFDAALAEYIAAQGTSLDMPGARLNLGRVHQDSGQPDAAGAQFSAALALDPDLVTARVALANLHNANARAGDAERVLREGIRRGDGTGELRYTLGLLLAEHGRVAEAERELDAASRLPAASARVHYNLGLARMHLHKPSAAAAALAKAHAIDPADPAITYALAVLHAQAGKREDATRWVGETLRLAPNDATARQLLEQLRAAP